MILQELTAASAPQHHFKIVLEEDVAEFPELFGAVADSYFDAKMFSDALDVYQDMAENEDVRRSVLPFSSVASDPAPIRRPTDRQSGSRWHSATTSSATSSRQRSATKLVRADHLFN